MIVMRALHRSLIAILLCLILPLQAGAAIARSVSVMTHGEPAAAAAPSQALHQMQAQLLPADVHHHFHAAQHAGMHDHASQLQQDPQDHQHHQHQRGDCQSCAKCCLMAVAAPPPVDIPPPVPAIARAMQLFSPTDFTTRFPDGPERPPRPLAA